MDEYAEVVKQLEFVTMFRCSQMESDIVLQHVLEYLKSIAPVAVKPFGTTPYCGMSIIHAKCPKCNTMINSIDNKECCGKCGQRLIWN